MKDNMPDEEDQDQTMGDDVPDEDQGQTMGDDAPDEDQDMENDAPEGGAIEIDEQSPDEDERQAMRSLRAPERQVIDEQSPDEDERQAMQNLRAPEGEVFEEDEDESHAMQKIRAPKQSASKRIILSGASIKSKNFYLFNCDSYRR